MVAWWWIPIAVLLTIPLTLAGTWGLILWAVRDPDAVNDALMDDYDSGEIGRKCI